MKNGKMDVVIFQADPNTIDLTFDEMVNRWKEGIESIPQIGNYRIIDMTDKWRPGLEEMHKYIEDADAALGVWIHKGVINEELFTQHPNLKYISTLGHGFEDFDVPMTRRYGVTLTNTIYGDVTIAQYAIALLLNICHNVSLHSEYSKTGYWMQKGVHPSISYNDLISPQIELYNRTMGIIGLGSIGLWTAKMAAGLGMKVIASSRSKKEGPEYDFVEQVSMDELLERSDVISVHCPHTKETEKLLDKAAFAKMKDGVIIINTARGAIIDEEALLEALNSRKVYMAGLDVIANEPPKGRIPLMDCPYTFITSHIAWRPKAARLRAIDLAIENYRSYLAGEPCSAINLK